MTAKWETARYIEGGWNESYTNRLTGYLFVLNSNFSFKVSLTTQSSFVVNCTVKTDFFIQLIEDIRASYYLFKRGILFKQKLKTLSSYITANIEIQCKSASALFHLLLSCTETNQSQQLVTTNFSIFSLPKWLL